MSHSHEEFLAREQLNARVVEARIGTARTILSGMLANPCSDWTKMSRQDRELQVDVALQYADELAKQAENLESL